MRINFLSMQFLRQGTFWKPAKLYHGDFGGLCGGGAHLARIGHHIAEHVAVLGDFNTRVEDLVRLVIAAEP
jgi:hypothetical protein